MPSNRDKRNKDPSEQRRARQGSSVSSAANSNQDRDRAQRHAGRPITPPLSSPSQPDFQGVPALGTYPTPESPPSSIPRPIQRVPPPHFPYSPNNAAANSPPQGYGSSPPRVQGFAPPDQDDTGPPTNALASMDARLGGGRASLSGSGDAESSQRSYESGRSLGETSVRPAGGPGPQGPGLSSGRMIRASRRYQELDPHFTVRPAKFFKLGRVFKAYWHENQGGPDRYSAVTSAGRALTRDNRYGQNIYSKIRWFIVVKREHDHCVCVPIVTYRGQGVRKDRVIKHHHAIAYDPSTVPCAEPGEAAGPKERPMRRPICLQPDEPGDILERMSRIDYSRYYTVEYNVKVMNFGYVHPNWEREFVGTFQAVFLDLRDNNRRPETDDDDDDDDGQRDYAVRGDDGRQRDDAVQGDDDDQGNDDDQASDGAQGDDGNEDNDGGDESDATQVPSRADTRRHMYGPQASLNRGVALSGQANRQPGPTLRWDLPHSETSQSSTPAAGYTRPLTAEQQQYLARGQATQQQNTAFQRQYSQMHQSQIPRPAEYQSQQQPFTQQQAHGQRPPYGQQTEYASQQQGQQSGSPQFYEQQSSQSANPGSWQQLQQGSGQQSSGGSAARGSRAQGPARGSRGQGSWRG